MPTKEEFAAQRKRDRAEAKRIAAKAQEEEARASAWVEEGWAALAENRKAAQR